MVQGADRYHLIVARDRYFTDAVYTNDKVRTTSVVVPDLPAGMYYWRVSSVDGKGRESLFSRFFVFRLVQDQTPPFLAMDDPIVLEGDRGGRIYLAGAVEPGSRLTINGTPTPLGPDGTFRIFTGITQNADGLDIKAVDPAGNILTQRRKFN
jgi:hypothetical protein